MPQDSVGRETWPHAHVYRFVGLLAGWSVALFGTLRTAWATEHVALPLTHAQAAVAAWYAGRAWQAVSVTVECSGTDMAALCAGAILAYPASWRNRLLGVLVVLPALLVLNTTRILTLSLAATSPGLFGFLHLYFWPFVLIASAAGLAFAWMRTAVGARPIHRRVIAAGLVSLGLFVVAVPFVSASRVVADACVLIAQSTATAMHLAGAHASASGAVLLTSRGQFVVTPDCLLSPIIPLWVLGVLVWPLSWRRRLVGLLLAGPVVALLAVARLLVLAVPGSWMASPLVLVHGFHQFVLFAGVVITTAVHGGTGRTRRIEVVFRALVILACSALVGMLVGSGYARLVVGVTSLVTPWAPHARLSLAPGTDVQGALGVLPAYQTLLFAAMLWAFGRRQRPLPVAGALLLLFVSQVVLLVAIGEFTAHGGPEPHALLLRAWAAVWPVALGFLLIRRNAAPRGEVGPADAYRAYWQDVGGAFPDLGGAASTRFYQENEQRLIREQFGDLVGQRILKSDLWDEARNTRILQWMQQQGAEVAGVDISRPVVSMARRQFPDGRLEAAAGDVRALPFPAAAFDAVYSMGTIEHFDESDVAVREIFRVLRPGGRAIIGVPNRHDPFLRPLLVEILWRLGLYAYGYEKSFSRTRLRRLLEAEGFTVRDAGAILFIPGWLRMLDLLCHTRWRAFVPLTSAAVGAFVWLDARVPALRRHGYLVVAVGERPVHDRNGGASA